MDFYLKENKNIYCNDCQIPTYSHYLFKNIEKKDFLSISREKYNLPANSIIYNKDDSSEYLYIIRSGLVCINTIGDNFKPRTTELATQADTIGLEAIHQKKYLQDAISLTPISLCKIHINKDDLANMNLTDNVFSQWNKKYKNQTNTIKFSSGATTQRIIKLFEYLSKHTYLKQQNSFYMPSLKNISSIVNISAENCSRAISKLKLMNIVFYKDDIAYIKN